MNEAEKLAKKFHEIYERRAPEFSYKTREASAVPWEDVPENNKNLMIAVCTEILEKPLSGELMYPPEAIAAGYRNGLIDAAKAECLWCAKGRELVDGMHVLTGTIAGQLTPCKVQATQTLLEKL